MEEERLNNLCSVPNIDERFNRMRDTVDRVMQTLITRAQTEENGHLKEIRSLRTELREVKSKVDKFMQENAQLRKDNAELSEENTQLRQEMAELRETVEQQAAERESHGSWGLNLLKVGLGLATVAIVVPAACWGISKLFG